MKLRGTQQTVHNAGWFWYVLPFLNSHVCHEVIEGHITKILGHILGDFLLLSHTLAYWQNDDRLTQTFAKTGSHDVLLRKDPWEDM